MLQLRKFSRPQLNSLKTTFFGVNDCVSMLNTLHALRRQKWHAEMSGLAIILSVRFVVHGVGLQTSILMLNTILADTPSMSGESESVN